MGMNPAEFANIRKAGKNNSWYRGVQHPVSHDGALRGGARHRARARSRVRHGLFVPFAATGFATSARNGPTRVPAVGRAPGDTLDQTGEVLEELCGRCSTKSISLRPGAPSVEPVRKLEVNQSEVARTHRCDDSYISRSACYSMVHEQDRWMSANFSSSGMRSRQRPICASTVCLSSLRVRYSKIRGSSP